MNSSEPNSSKQRYTSLLQTAGQHDELLNNILRLTGAVYSIGLIRDFFLLTLELAMVDMVVKWINPRPGSRYLSLIARSRECQHWSDVEVKWPDNWESEQSVVAINVCCPRWLSQIWGFLAAFPHPTRHLPPWSGPCSRLHDVRACGTACMNAPFAWKQCCLWLRYLWWYLSGYLHIWRPLVAVRLNINTQESTYTRLAWNEPH